MASDPSCAPSGGGETPMAGAGSTPAQGFENLPTDTSGENLMTGPDEAVPQRIGASPFGGIGGAPTAGFDNASFAGMGQGPMADQSHRTVGGAVDTPMEGINDVPTQDPIEAANRGINAWPFRGGGGRSTGGFDTTHISGYNNTPTEGQINTSISSQPGPSIVNTTNTPIQGHSQVFTQGPSANMHATPNSPHQKVAAFRAHATDHVLLNPSRSERNLAGGRQTVPLYSDRGVLRAQATWEARQAVIHYHEAFYRPAGIAAPTNPKTEASNRLASDAAQRVGQPIAQPATTIAPSPPTLNPVGGTIVGNTTATCPRAKSRSARKPHGSRGGRAGRGSRKAAASTPTTPATAAPATFGVLYPVLSASGGQQPAINSYTGPLQQSWTVPTSSLGRTLPSGSSSSDDHNGIGDNIVPRGLSHFMICTAAHPPSRGRPQGNEASLPSNKRVRSPGAVTPHQAPKRRRIVGGDERADGSQGVMRPSQSTQPTHQLQQVQQAPQLQLQCLRSEYIPGSGWHLVVGHAAPNSGQTLPPEGAVLQGYPETEPHDTFQARLKLSSSIATVLLPSFLNKYKIVEACLQVAPGEEGYHHGCWFVRGGVSYPLNPVAERFPIKFQLAPNVLQDLPVGDPWALRNEYQ